MSTIAEHYEYAKISLAAYIQLESVVSLSGEVVSNASGIKTAGNPGAQELIPNALASQMFVDPGVWHIVHPYHNDTVGFAATLFERNGEKVLGIRGTEPSVDGQLVLDLVKADLMDIGIVGLAINQAVSESLINQGGLP